MTEYDALKTLLESVPELSGRVRDSVVDGFGEIVRDTYLVLYGTGPDTLDDGRLGSIPWPDSDAEYSFPARAVSTDGAGVRLVARLVMGAVGQKPILPGRRCDPIQVFFEDAKVDNSVSPPMHYLDMSIEFWSRRP